MDWVDIDVRLPKVNEYVVVQDLHGECYFANGYTVNEHGIYFNIGDGRLLPSCDVVAWFSVKNKYENKKHIKSYEEIAKLHNENLPTLRIGQLFENFRNKYGDLFYIQDEVLVKRLGQYIKDIKGDRVICTNITQKL